MRVEVRRQVEMLLHPANARFEFADEHAMADDDRVIFDDGAAKPDDLFARGLVFGVVLACIVARSDATSARSE